MKNLRTRFERFCFRNRDKGIPNLMLYVSLGAGLVYLFTTFTQNNILYYWLTFDRELILQGQVWRLISYPLTYGTSNLLLTVITLYCYYSLGRAIENIWGTMRFNLFYFTGIVLMDVYCMLFGGRADAYYLNLNLFLSYATMFPDSQFLLFFIIPIRARIFALIDLALVLIGLVLYPFPDNLFSVIALANYFLFFGKDVLNVLPQSWRAKGKRTYRPKAQPKAKVVPFPGSAEPKQTSKEPYTHRCVICGKTDISHPDLEFRYCSRCSGYRCYCIDHINNHEHVE